MSDYLIYLTVPDYLCQWLTHTFGNPVVLIKNGPESRVLNEFLVKTPANKQPDNGKDANISIQIPWFKGKDPREYNYIHNSGKSALIDSFQTLFDLNILEEVFALEKFSVNCRTYKLIYAFMEKHGIEEQHFDTVMQRYRRLKNKYKKVDINV